MHRLLRLHYGAITLTAAAAPATARQQLHAYFSGDLAALGAIPVATGGTPFERAVWAGLRTIPPGVTISYAELARRIGRPAAMRAVGAANGANPIGIVVPCHRVIGAGGALTGYGGGLHRKQWLLRHEAARPS
jgi:methylated-DNA-[protein]-cysteine S-methyltransferase